MDKRMALKTVGAAVVAGVIFAASPLYDDADDFMRGALGMPQRGADPADFVASATPLVFPAPTAQPNASSFAADQPDQLQPQRQDVGTDPATSAAPGNVSLRQLLLLSTIADGRPVEGTPSAGPSNTYSSADPSLTALQRMAQSNWTAGPASGRESRRNFAGVGSVDSNIGAINETNGQFLAPAGPGGYVDPRNGTVYAPAGPDGVVNTQTGEYAPVSY